jgi:pyruvate/2-oxoglutarate dehydrogenase complex dihydrolipoamide acyltransferase (E2) component
MTDVTIPDDAWPGDEEGTIASWLYSTGDEILRDVVIAEVMIEKAVLELHAPVAGRLVIVVPAETAIRRGQVVARIVS